MTDKKATKLDLVDRKLRQLEDMYYYSYPLELRNFHREMVDNLFGARELSSDMSDAEEELGLFSECEPEVSPNEPESEPSEEYPYVPEFLGSSPY